MLKATLQQSDVSSAGKSLRRSSGKNIASITVTKGWEMHTRQKSGLSQGWLSAGGEVALTPANAGSRRLGKPARPAL